MDDIRRLWDRCREFHGHACNGLLIGFTAALYASRLIGLESGDNEQNVCISENDACGVDAIQTVLGCTLGRGNLLFHITGKMAYSFYRRCDGRSVRLVLAGEIPPLEGKDIAEYMSIHDPSGYFAVKETAIPLPSRARIFDSYICDGCGEKTGAEWIHIQDGRHLCPDCCIRYDRFRV